MPQILSNTVPPLSTSDAIAAAIARLKAGEPVGLPTETVYGLAADAHNPQAVAAIFTLKGRPAHNPLIVHIGSKAMACQYVIWNALAERLASAYWPGPLTLVLPLRAGAGIAPAVNAGGDTLAVRAPAHPVAQAVLAAFGGGLAAPSANRSGRISPTCAAHVATEFPDTELMILDGGPCEIGLESTVVDCTGDAPVVLRPGSIDISSLPEINSHEPAKAVDPFDRSRPWERLREAQSDPEKSERQTVGKNSHEPAKAARSIDCSGTEQQFNEKNLKSPGQLASHYAPSLPVRLNVHSASADEAMLAFGPHPVAGAGRTLNLSERGDMAEAAANLFAMLRTLDDPVRFSAIAVMPIPPEGIGAAINDRLRRAAVAKKPPEPS